jgi:hypothetical protein
MFPFAVLSVMYRLKLLCVRMPRMSALRLVLWGFLAILGAVALSFVTGLINPNEKVNGLWLVVAANVTAHGYLPM